MNFIQLLYVRIILVAMIERGRGDGSLKNLYMTFVPYDFEMVGNVFIRWFIMNPANQFGERTKASEIAINVDNTINITPPFEIHIRRKPTAIS